MPARHLDPDETTRDLGRIEADPDRRTDERDRQHRQEKEEDELEHPEARPEHQVAGDRVAGDTPLPDGAEPEDVAADLAHAAGHVRAVDVAHDNRRDEQDRRVDRVQSRQAVEDALAVLVAQVVANDQRDEQEPE